MQKQERLERTVAGEPVDRAPVALWRHFPGDDQRYSDLARSTLDFQNAYDWDFLRVMPSRLFQVVDYGIQDIWRGDLRGWREVSKRAIRRSLDWTDLRPLSPARGALARQVECLRLLSQALASEKVPLLQTVYSPFVQAMQLAGRQKTLRDLRLRADRLRTGLNHLTESTIRFLDALRKLPGIAGIFLVTAAASHDVMPAEEYAAKILPHIKSIFAALPPHWWLNIVQVGGTAPMLRLFSQLPAQALHWEARANSGELAEVKTFFPGAVCGGLHDYDDLLQGSPALLSSVIHDALIQTESRRFILAGSGAGYVSTPLSNYRAVRSIVESQA